MSDGTPTTASVVNFGVGQTVANLALAKLASNGTVTVRNGSKGTVHLVVDVQGYAASSGRTTSPPPPARLLDTRSGATANGQVGVIQPGASVTVTVTGVNGTNVPAGATADLLNLTVVGPTATGQLAISDGAVSGGSLGNFSAGTTVATFAVAKLSTAGTVVVTNQSKGSLQLIVDSQGFVGP